MPIIGFYIKMFNRDFDTSVLTNINKKLIALRFPQICLAPKNLKRISEIT